MAPDYAVRPMRSEDVPEVERLTAEGFYELDVRTHHPGLPEPRMRPPGRAEAWRQRMDHVLRHDPGGCWVADDGDRLVGATAALRRDLLWVLSTFVVRPGLQGGGIGKQLLAAALNHGRGCLRGLISSSSDPAAVRRYRLAGFSLHPYLLCTGRIPREVLPVVERVREGTASDIDLMDSVDRRVRDAAHGVDHESLLSMYRLVVVDRTTGSGYAYIDPEGGPQLVAATNRRTATDLLWECLAATDPARPATIEHLTAVNEWALDVGLAARMQVHTEGYLATRHMKPPAPYLPNGHFL